MLLKKIPDDLNEALAAERVVAVVGSGLSMAIGLPSWPRLLELLIAECENRLVHFTEAEELRDLLARGMFFEVAEECKTLLGNALYQDFMQRIFRPHGLDPSVCHKLLPKIPFRAILTTNYDCLLEQAYAAASANGEVPPVFTQKNIAQLARIAVEERLFILKMHGHIDDPETIILTSQDYASLIHNNPAYQAALSAVISSRVLLFIGYGLRDPDFELLLNQQVAIFNAFGQRHFALVPDAKPVLCRAISRRYNISAIPYSSADQHAELANILRTLGQYRTSSKQKVTKAGEPVAISRCPYKFLDYYETADVDIFFGREAETCAILQEFLYKRLLILFGRSGVGKTSLLRAALAPELSERGFLVVHLRLTRPSLESMCLDFSAAAEIKLDFKQHSPEQLAVQIATLLRPQNRPVAVLIDQFERLFEEHDRTVIDEVGRFINALTQTDLCAVHVLLSLKEECFVQLNDLSATVPNVFNNRFQLNALTTSGARSAVVGPAQAAGFKCEIEFADLVVADLDRKGIEPPQLQVICTAVFNALSPTDQIMSVAAYERLGGAANILATYISYVLNSFRDTDRAIARLALKTFVSAAGSSTLVAQNALLAELTHHCQADQAQSVIGTLIFQRLLRVIQSEANTFYELSHEFLVTQISKWISEEEREIRRLKEVMEHEQSICQHLGTLVPLDRARFLKMNIAHANFSEAEQALIERSLIEGEEAERSRKSVEDQLRQAQKIETIGTLVSGIAHDFNNLLTGSLGYTELALHKLNNTEDTHIRKFHEDLEHIHKITTHGMDLVRRILSFSRKSPNKAQVIILPELVQNVFIFARRVIPENILFETDCPADIWPVEGDDSQLQQVLMNLIINSRDAMPKGGKLKITLANCSIENARQLQNRTIMPGDYTVFNVTDNGCGMDETIRSRIFEPFFTTKQAGKGTGLGLAIVYGIIREHKGEIEVESEPGKGTLFRVFLPRAKALPAEKTAIDTQINVFHGTERILVVDDDLYLRRMIVRTLSEFGYKIIEAGDGLEAVEIYRQNGNSIDAVVMDVTMPGLNGPEAAGQIKALTPDAKILLMSAYNLDHMRAIWKDVCAEFLLKPFHMNEFLMALRRMLEISRKQSTV